MFGARQANADDVRGSLVVDDPRLHIALTFYPCYGASCMREAGDTSGGGRGVQGC